MATSVNDKPKKGRHAESEKETDTANYAKAIQQSLVADQWNEDFNIVREKSVRQSNLRKEYRKKDLRDAQREIKWQKRKPYDAAAKRRAAIQAQLEERRNSAADTDSSRAKKTAQKQNDSRTRKPASRSRLRATSNTKSAAKNGKRISDRDRNRRAQRAKGSKASGNRFKAKKSKSTVAALKPKKAVAFEVPTKMMSRSQIGKEEKEQEDIPKEVEYKTESSIESTSSIHKLGSGGSRIKKPTGSKDLASKRAAYFESLLQKQE